MPGNKSPSRLIFQEHAAFRGDDVQCRHAGDERPARAAPGTPAVPAHSSMEANRGGGAAALAAVLWAIRSAAHDPPQARLVREVRVPRRRQPRLHRMRRGGCEEGECMKRWIVILLLLLIGGAMVNVAVAWAQIRTAEYRARQVLALRVNPQPRPFDLGTSEPMALSSSHGAPIPWFERELMFGESDIEWVHVIHYDGFIINTLFYALLLWLLLFTPFAARRALRRKRRLCEKCAYPVGVSPVCTECGAVIPSPLRGRVREGVKT